MQIKSIIAKEGLRGYIYIESIKQTHVKRLIEGVGNLARGRWKQDVSIQLLNEDSLILLSYIYFNFFIPPQLNYFYTKHCSK